MLTADQQSLLTAISAKKNNLQEMLRRPNVIACGVGYKVTNNGITDATNRATDQLTTNSHTSPR